MNAQSADQIEKSQEILVEAFQRLISVNHPEDRFLLAKAIQVREILSLIQIG